MKIRDVLGLIETIESGISLPLLQIKDHLYHVGTLDISKRKNNSHEGRGLSISTEPDAWMRINRGATIGDVYRVSKSGHEFVDMLSIDNEQYEKLFSWGIGNGYITRNTLYKLSYYDDELDDTVFIELQDKDELDDELESFDMSYEEAIENGSLEVIENGYFITEKFKSDTGSTHKDLIVSLYCQKENIDVDGLYWEEKLSVSQYSAPRGVIFDHKVHTWNIEKVDN